MRALFRCLVLALLALVLVVASLATADEQQDKPATPAEQYQTLLKQYQTALLAYQKARQGAKTYEEQSRLKYPWANQFAPPFLALAQQHPRDPAALDALLWVATHLSSQ